MFRRIEFRAIRGLKDNSNILESLKVFGLVPRGSIHNHYIL
ncbi:MAG: hypothetical protein JETT_0009 [Candidatus Jettenia ecosi]|uniref:Uncharacterized protein n=1 Tax=Candidatus Jettenia ecosi TaxID=2494326 RepID=A0A533QFK9_9BACT|nr:MAG: hypothetical protein JETT_0009 [Candidatus Jettenia ecosi]